MNDDFLRRAWRRPPAAFEHQLRERLRQQEPAPTPRSRPTWGLLVASVLVGGSALAAVTYLTAKHLSWLSSSTSEIQPTPAAGALIARSDANAQTTSQSRGTATMPARKVALSAMPPEEQDNLVGSTREADSTSGSPLDASSSSRGARSASPASVRIAVSPELAVLAEEIATRFTHRATPHTEITSADAAFQSLCSDESPPLDIVLASRRISRGELHACNKQGVREAKLGYMAMVITGAKAGSPMQLSADTILRALLKKVPSPDDPGRLIDNPYTDWNQIDGSLEPRRIDVLGPPRDSQHFRVFAATVLEPACDRSQALQTGDRKAYEELCHTLRDDGVYKEATWDNTFVGQRLWADPNVVAVIDYSFYSANSADLLGSMLAGPAPTRSSIMDGSYAGARSLYLYVSKARYRDSPTVSSFLDDYLRRMDHAQHRWIMPPQGSNGSRRFFEPLPLTEVKL